MPPQCPRCQSFRIGRNNYGKKSAGLLGASAGAYGGYIAVASGARAGALLGGAAGPGGAAIGGISGAVIGALLGGSTGASAGVALGSVLDERVLDNHRCMECHLSFSAEPDSTAQQN
jgi:hypothetical protein